MKEKRGKAKLSRYQRQVTEDQLERKRYADKLYYELIKQAFRKSTKMKQEIIIPMENPIHGKYTIKTEYINNPKRIYVHRDRMVKSIGSGKHSNNDRIHNNSSNNNTNQIK